MRHTFLSVVALLLLFSSCAVTSYYQLFETSNKDNLKEEDGKLVYENTDVRVTYNLWGDGGRMFFRIYNKTEQILFVNVERSHFIRNKLSLNYYEAEQTTRSVGSGIWIEPYSRVTQVQTYNETTIKNEKVENVPPNSFMIVGERTIAPVEYTDCNFKTYPKGDDIFSLSFNDDNTPLYFRNYIVYDFKESFENAKVVDNYFWVSKISSMKEDKFVDFDYPKDCEGKPTSYDKTVATYHFKSPKNFYVKY